MNDLSGWIEDFIGITPIVQSKIVTSVVLIVVLWIAYKIVSNIVSEGTQKWPSRYRWQKATYYTTIVLGVLLIGRIWFEGIDSIATYLGLLTAGVAIALQEIVVSLAGWAFITWWRPFQLGDRIEIGEHTGDVIDIRLFQFTLMEVGKWVDADQTTGRIIHIPNAQVFREPQANYGQAFRYIWNEIPVMITFESNWQKAKDILVGLVNKHSDHLSAAAERRLREVSKRYMILQARLTPMVYTSVAESGVLLTMRYMCEPTERRDSTHIVWEEILHEFANHIDIEFAYPTQREIRG